MSDIRKKIEEIAVEDTGSWIEKAQYRRENRAWLRKSQRIAVRILSVLNEKGMQQKDLAEAMDVSPQQISKIVKGKQNLTLETISKLETVLDVKLFEVPAPHVEINVERKEVRTTLSKSAVVKSRKDFDEANIQVWQFTTTEEIAA